MESELNKVDVRDVKELKFLLKLLGKQDYRASITELKPNSKTPASERDRICRQLRERDLVGYSEEIQKWLHLN